ncbi:MAG: hypothetical protein Q9228_003070 [Teloschistes exilis]
MHRRNAIKILQWLAFSKQQLTLEEVWETRAINVDAKNAFDTDRRLEEEIDILSICPSLVTITTRPHTYGRDERKKMIKLAHFTVEEFIATDARFTGENTAREYANMVIAEHCVGYLIHIVQRLLDDGANVDEYGDSCKTALDEAAAHGHLALIELLLRAGTNIECAAVRRLLDSGAKVHTATKAKSPLVAACGTDHLSTAQLLLAQGANANAGTKEGPSALHITCLYYPQEWANPSEPESMLISTMQLLLNHGANIEADRDFGTPVHFAAHWANSSAMKVSMSAGADVKGQGPDGSLLTTVCQSTFVSGVDLLLGLGIDVNTQGGRFGNALQAASYKNSEPVVRKVLKAGARVNAQGGLYGTALRAASAQDSKRLPVVQLLIDEGPEVNAVGGIYGTALQAASSNGKKSMVQFLLEKGAKVNIQGGKYGNALQAASLSGSIATMGLLLGHGAEVNAHGG